MLEGTFGLIKHDPIQVELITGTRVLGKVEWSLGAHTGMIFHEPLQPSHPAIVELERRTRRALRQHPNAPLAGGSAREKRLPSAGHRRPATFRSRGVMETDCMREVRGALRPSACLGWHLEAR